MTRTALLAIATATLALACTSGDDATPTPTPTPEATPSSTATPPPEVTRTATATATATPRPPRDPTFAPDGRTAIPEVDAIIEVLRTGDADALGALYDGIGRRYCADTTTGLGEDRDLPPGEWSALLANGDRSLYSVSWGDVGQQPRREIDVVLSVVTDDSLEGWSFGLRDGAVVDLKVGCETQPSAYAPGVSYQYERFLVLPPIEELPQGPPAHPISVRTGTEVDAVLDVIEAGDADALLALVDYEIAECSAADGSPLGCIGPEREGSEVRVLQQRQCSNQQFFRRRTFVERRLPEVAAPRTTLHGIARVPEGFRSVSADYSVILVNPGANPYDWETSAIYVREGRIVGWDIGCNEDPSFLYPPFAYPVPPAGVYDGDSGVPAGVYDGDSGIAAIDAALAAFEAHDVDALVAAVDWELVGCLEPGVSLGIGQPPYCEGDEQPGDLIETFTFASCEGGGSRRADAIEGLESFVEGSWTVYAIVDRGPTQAGFETRYQVILTRETEEPLSAISLFFNEQGLRWLWTGCGPTEPQFLLRPGNTPDFLLAPPA